MVVYKWLRLGHMCCFAYGSLPDPLQSNFQGRIITDNATGDFSLTYGGGNLSGSVFRSPIVGVFDESVGKLDFIVLRNLSDPSTFEVYTGYRYNDPTPPLPDEPFVGATVEFAGTYKKFSGNPADNTHAWRASVLYMP